MAVKLRNGEHHRNPSGFYNKVKYLSGHLDTQIFVDSNKNKD